MKSPELLAPAGNLPAGIVAFESGADAVYCGLKRFSARDRAENFSFDDLSRLLTYAHERGKKAYVAFNTLVKESEIPDAARMIAKIAELGADALIVQDIGIVRIVREYFPFLPMHASTQMAVHNSSSAKVAARMGLSRVILERQLTIGEIRDISAGSPVETEIFIHGAMCCSLSGQCLLSSWMGGFSGNRGRCKQACRLPSCEDGGVYPLSTRDLCMADAIFALRRMKIASFKIEGRLRPTDYISNVVSAYRLLLDSPENDHASALKEARRRLSLGCGRDFVAGFRSDFKDLINPGRSGSSGIKCGEVRRTDRGGFFAWVSGRLHLGDKVRVQRESGASATSFTIKRIIQERKDVKSVRGALAFIPCDRDVENGDAIYKIGESTGAAPAKFAGLPLSPRAKIDFKIQVSRDSLRVDILAPALEWSVPHAFQAAKSRPLDAESLRKLFSESASDKFAAGGIEVSIDGDYFTPISGLKQLRRDFWNWVAANIAPENPRSKLCEEGLSGFLEFHGRLGGDVKGVAPAHKGGGEFSLPSFCPEGGLSSLSGEIKTAFRNGFRRFRVASLAHFDLLKGLEGVEVTASFPLQCANSLAACEFRSLGASAVQAWVELERIEVEKLVSKSPVNMEIYLEGRIPLFYTRGVVEGDFCEIRGRRFPVRRTKEGLSILLSPEVLRLPQIEGCSGFRETPASGDDTAASTFNFEKEWK